MTGLRRLGNWLYAPLALSSALLLSGCALAPFDEDSAIRRGTTTIGITGKLAEPAPFVRDSRPEETAYQPVGITPKRDVDPRNPAGVRELEQQLRDRQANSVKQANRPAPPSSYDGRIEPGYKVAPPPPLPEGAAPKIESPRATTPAARAARRATRQENEGQ